MTFRALCGDSPDTLTTVARFLSLLELFREGAVGLRPGHPARRADRALDRRRRRGRRGAGDRRVRRRPDRGAARAGAPRDETRRQNDDRDRATRPTTSQETLVDVPLAALRPVAGGGADGRRPAARRRDAGDRGRLPGRRGRRRAAAARRGVRRAGPRLRAAQRRRRLALLHPRGVRRGRRGRSSSRGSRPGSPRPPWRRSPWSPTSSRSRGPGSRRSAGSTSTA